MRKWNFLIPKMAGDWTNYPQSEMTRKLMEVISEVGISGEHIRETENVCIGDEQNIE